MVMMGLCRQFRQPSQPFVVKAPPRNGFCSLRGTLAEEMEDRAMQALTMAMEHFVGGKRCRNRLEYVDELVRGRIEEMAATAARKPIVTSCSISVRTLNRERTWRFSRFASGQILQLPAALTEYRTCHRAWSATRRTLGLVIERVPQARTALADSPTKGIALGCTTAFPLAYALPIGPGERRRPRRRGRRSRTTM